MIIALDRSKVFTADEDMDIRDGGLTAYVTPEEIVEVVEREGDSRHLTIYWDTAPVWFRAWLAGASSSWAIKLMERDESGAWVRTMYIW